MKRTSSVYSVGLVRAPRAPRGAVWRAGWGGDDEESTTTKDSIREGVGDFKKVLDSKRKGHMAACHWGGHQIGMIGMSDTSWLVFKSVHGTPRDADSLLTPSFSSQHFAICFESS